MTKPTRREENKLFRRGIKLVAGVDEAGRGAWAGPLVAAAVILPRRFHLPGLNDSKKLAPQVRERLFGRIVEQAIAWQVSVISVEDIDAHGVGVANRRALIESVQRLSRRPDYVLVDGFSVSCRGIPAKRVIHGDARVVSIAAASIVAKVTRDRMMVVLHKKYPQYHFHQHKGYGTALHQRAIRKLGSCPLHRRSFSPIKMLNKVDEK